MATSGGRGEGEGNYSKRGSWGQEGHLSTLLLSSVVIWPIVDLSHCVPMVRSVELS